MKALTFLLLMGCSVWAQQLHVDVYFDFDQHELTLNAQSILNLWKKEANAFEVLRIEGYCDWKGNVIYNDSLAQKRIQAVCQYLKTEVDFGMIPKKVVGERFDQLPNQSENRKVSIWYETKKPRAKPQVYDVIKQAKVGDKIRLPTLNFYNNSARLLPESEPILLEVLCALEENPSLKIDIQGHICCQLNGDINDVSTARARAVYLYLIRNKIAKKRLHYSGLGTSDPIYKIPEKSKEEERENRRVEVLIIEK
ncbi:MAG: hypothetical protein CFE24_13370 [Flavobacterium sp. BFFFF2]|nr:MAG: hypothetical protein CFE24_13370 [Flavobacterium sp. BFFFF2]